ncbi:unnamed protein product [Linum trigynum]|uniref:Transposase MuDR plant domain-containing protein n=1 Tax=Linum trigynum TaxID=586398 RepID=A0AAV2CLV8_9ROSI
MDGTRRVDRMVYRYPKRESGSLWHEEYLITTQDEVDAMLEFMSSNNLSKAEMFVYTEPVVGVGGHSGHGQTSGIHGGGELYGDHPYQSYHDPHSYFQYQEQGEGHHQSYEEEVQPDRPNQPQYNFHSGSGSFHNCHYGADEGAFHELDQMEDVMPAPVSDPSDEEGENNVSADSSDPFEGVDDSGPESDSANDDEGARDRVPVPYYNHIPDDNWMVDSDMEPPEVPIWGPLSRFMKGQQFGSKKEVRHTIETEAMTRHFEWHTTHSNTKRLIVRCHNHHEGCNVRIRAINSKRHGHWVISRAVNTHMCVSSITSQGHRQLKSRVVAATIKHLIEQEPDLKVKFIIADIASRYGYMINYKKAWHGKQKALAAVFGDWEESYAFLPKLILALEASNSGTVFSPRYQDEEIQPPEPVDGTFLTGKYKGTLLIASGADANRQVFPLAFAIVEGENADSYGWFSGKFRFIVLGGRT